MMLFDLTGVCGQRVAQVDELHLGGRHWVSSTTLLIALGGAVAGMMPAVLIRLTPPAAGQWWPFLLSPLTAGLAVWLFGRRRSEEGETTRRRIERIMDERRGMDGRMFVPGSVEPYDPRFREIIILHDHPIDPKVRRP